MRLLVVSIALLAAAPAALAQTDQVKAQACFDKIDGDADAAYQDALAWLSASPTAAAARQCAAMALVALGQADEGAVQLEALANSPDAGGAAAQGVYFAQAGNAWLVAHEPQKAIDAITSALKVRTGDGELFKDRARARIALKQWPEAGDDLDSAISLQANDSEAYRMRGLALLKQNKLASAWNDVNEAMRMAPKDVNVLLLRGDVREAMRLAGMDDPAGLDNTLEPRTRIVGN